MIQFYAFLLSMFPLDKAWSHLVFVDEKVRHQGKVAVVSVRKKEVDCIVKFSKQVESNRMRKLIIILRIN